MNKNKVKIKLTENQKDELDYISRLVGFDNDGSEYEPNDFINVTILNKVWYLELEDKDVDDMIGICDHYIYMAKENLSLGEKSYLGILNSYNSIKKKIEKEREVN